MNLAFGLVLIGLGILAAVLGLTLNRKTKDKNSNSSIKLISNILSVIYIICGVISVFATDAFAVMTFLVAIIVTLCGVMVFDVVQSSIKQTHIPKKS